MQGVSCRHRLCNYIPDIDSIDRLELVKLIEEFKAAAAMTDDSVRQVNSLSLDPNPPMR
jgi:hypothetical protein